MDNQETLIQNNIASSQRTSTTTNPSSSNQCTTTSTKEGKEIGLRAINKSLLMKLAIECAKVTHPTNANVNDYKRQFSCKENLSKDDMFALMKKI